MIKICAWCGKEFEHKHPLKTYCSDLCAKLSHNQKCSKNQKRRLAMIPKKTRICIVCGKEFVPGRGGALVCSQECREQYATSNRSQTQGCERIGKHRLCVVCGKEFESRYNLKICSEECRKIRDRKKKRAFYESYKLRDKKEKEQLVEVEHRVLDGTVLDKAQMTVDEYNRTHGTNYSYGQYVFYVESKGVK